MYFELSYNCAALAELLRQKARSAPRVVKKALTDATVIIYTESRGQLSELIYNQPIPILRRFRRLRNEDNSFRAANRPSNKAAWRRTSTLLRGERAFYDRLGQFETSIDNKTPYASARHELNRPSPIDGKTRLAPWRAMAFQNAGPRAVETFREALRAGMDT